MVSHCPKCNSYQEQKYLGVSCRNPEYLKIFKCNNCEVFYTLKKIKEKTDTKPQLLRKREAIPLLKRRTSCLKCQEFKNNNNIERPPMDSKSVDYEYEYVVFVGNMIQKNGKVINKFYCRNHKKHFQKQKYQFRTKDQEEKLMKLNTFIEESTSNYFYKELRKLYKNTDIKHAHKLEQYKKNFRILYDIGLPQTILAKIFHTSQTTIYRYIKEKEFSRKQELYIEKLHKAIFLTRVKANDEMISSNQKKNIGNKLAQQNLDTKKNKEKS